MVLIIFLYLSLNLFAQCHTSYTPLKQELEAAKFKLNHFSDGFKQAILENEILKRTFKHSNSRAWPGIFCCVYEDCNFEKTTMICDTNTCKCPKNYDFGAGIIVNMEWNNTAGRCHSSIGSACDFSPISQRDGIDCVFGASCNQIVGLPPGMGHCVQLVK